MPKKSAQLSTAQMAFLESVAKKIPSLLEAIQMGNQRSEYILGRRQINGRQVRLILIAEVVDAGANPLATHSGRTTATDKSTFSTSASSSSPAESAVESVAETPVESPVDSKAQPSKTQS